VCGCRVSCSRHGRCYTFQFGEKDLKTLVLVSGIQDVAEKVKNHLHIVSVNSWDESVLYLSGRVQDTVVFFGRDVPVERFLKSVEDFRGNLLVYSEVDVDATMRSRFSRVLRGNRPIVWKEIGKPSDLEGLLEQVKRSVCK